MCVQLLFDLGGPGENGGSVVLCEGCGSCGHVNGSC